MSLSLCPQHLELAFNTQSSFYLSTHLISPPAHNMNHLLCMQCKQLTRAVSPQTILHHNRGHIGISKILGEFWELEIHEIHECFHHDVQWACPSHHLTRTKWPLIAVTAIFPELLSPANKYPFLNEYDRNIGSSGQYLLENGLDYDGMLFTYLAISKGPHQSHK